MNNIVIDYKINNGAFINSIGEPLTNGTFKAVKYKKIISKTKEWYEIDIEFKIISNNFYIENSNTPFYENTKIITVPLKALKTNKMLQYIPEEFFFDIEEEKLQERFICKKIHQDLKKLPLHEICVLEQGHNIVGNKHMFCLGDSIINPVTNANITYISSSDKQLKADNLAEKEYLKWIANFCTIDENNTPVLLLSVIAAIIRPLLRKIGIKNSFVTYIYGDTGTGKSTYAKLLTEIYDNVPNYLTLSSDITGIRELMLQTKDFVMLADDLNISGSSRVKASKESKISEIIQQAANGDKVNYNRKESYFEGLMFVTAEYILQNQSTINRCILVNITENMNTSMIEWLEYNKSLYITFIKKFISYIYDNFEENLEYIRNYNTKIQDRRRITALIEKYNTEKNFPGIIRIERTEDILNIALDIILNFLKKDLILDYEIIEKYNNLFKNSINYCINNVKNKVQKAKKEIGTEYIQPIVKLLSNVIDKKCNRHNNYNFLKGDFNSDYDSQLFDDKEIPYYAKNYNIYKRNRKLSNCYFFKDNDYICYRGEDIIKYFNQLKNFEYPITKQAICKQLKYYNLLKCKNGECSFPRESSKSHTRYYHIDISKLKEFIQEQEDYSVE